MAISVLDLIKDLKREDVLKDLLAIAAAVGLTTTAWQAGEPAYDLLAIFSELIAGKWNAYVAPWLRSKYLDFASGDWLTLRAWTDFNRFRFLATFATGTITIQNRSGLAFTIVPGQIRLRNTSGKTFTNTTGGFLSPWSGGPYPTLALSFQADEAGAASNTAIGGIPAYPTPPISAPPGVYALSNPAPLLGADQESDDALKDRCRLATGPLSPAGSRAAYEAIAKDPIGTYRRSGLPLPPSWPTAPPNINRVRVLEPGNNVVQVYLASPAGAAAGSVGTVGSDVWAANIAIQLFACPAGITCTVAPAVEVLVPVGTVTVYVDAKTLVTQAEAQAAATAALTSYFATLPIGGMRKVPGGTGYVFVDEVKAIAAASSAAIFKAECAMSDFALAPNHVGVPAFAVLAVLVTQ
jgi:hypothetical protein